jgi:membrane protein DedA with SNARE-associated domain
MRPGPARNPRSLISAFRSFGERWIVILAGLLWIALSLTIAAVVASSAESSNHWLGAFCVYSIIFILLPVVPFVGWIQRRQKHRPKFHSD